MLAAERTMMLFKLMSWWQSLSWAMDSSCIAQAGPGMRTCPHWSGPDQLGPGTPVNHPP